MLAFAALMLTACASQSTPPEGAVAARNRLTQLQANNELASRATIEIRDADLAVTAAEQPHRDPVLTRHLVLIAGQKVEIADAWAQSRLYEDQRSELSAQSEAARLESRTREADLARGDAAAARNQTQAARNAASAARSDAVVAQDQATAARNTAAAARNDASNARNQADLARAETEDLQRQLAELNALTTDRGLVVTLGDVLFETGRAELRGGTPDDLNKLAIFLNRYDTRTVQIEGHTDSVGTESSNIDLSQRRASSVQSYLVSQGVDSARITTAGLGEGTPKASNDTDTGRTQNRRVEVIIANVPQ